jgi:hypothetical protein
VLYMGGATCLRASNNACSEHAGRGRTGIHVSGGNTSRSKAGAHLDFLCSVLAHVFGANDCGKRLAGARVCMFVWVYVVWVWVCRH